MKPFSGLVIKSTVAELVIRLCNGHQVKAPPQPHLFFGQPVFVCYDRTKDRVGSVVTEFLEENPGDMHEPTEIMVIQEDVEEVDIGGSVN